MTTITRWVLAHRRWVAAFWIVVTIVGMATVGQATKSFSSEFSVPGRQGYVTNSQIQRLYHQGGRTSPLIGVVTLPAGTSVSSPAVRADLQNVQQRLERAVPGTRTASYASTGNRALVSGDDRTTFVLAFPPPDNESFGNNTRAAKKAQAALAGVTIAGAPVHVTGVYALQNQTGGSSGPGVFLESVLGGLGALVVLAFVFASLLAFVPLLMAIVSIMATFLVLWGVTAVTSVSMIVEFLVALIGLGVAIDYSLLVVVRWREERAHGRTGEDAVVRAMQTAGRAVVFSGTTVAIGLLAMIVLPLPFLRSIGYAGMLIPLVSVIVATTLLPIVLVTAGNRLDWPHVRSDDQASRSWTRWADLVVRRRWFAAAGAAVVLAALVVAATGLKPGQANLDTLSRQGDARAGLAQLERSGIGSGALAPMEILAPAGQAQHVASALARVPGVHGAV
ncbi:MAG TPA: MMPL family transporter, partial [Solirubrobacteraceae bacterium]|nr:MMPL family transporter [Solirubrobacteraceae bacterium]